MSQHFLLSSRARTLTLASVMRMSEEEVERVFIRLRWADNKGEPLLAIAILCNEVKGKSMLAMARDLGVQYKTSFLLSHKIREAMASEVRQTSIGGEGKRADIDGGDFGGYVKPAHLRDNRRHRRLQQYHSSTHKVIV